MLTQTAGALLPLPEWCRPIDRALAGYWALALGLLRIRGRPPQAS